MVSWGRQPTNGVTKKLKNLGVSLWQKVCQRTPHLNVVPLTASLVQKSYGKPASRWQLN